MDESEPITAKITRRRSVNMFGELSHGHWVLLENAMKEKDGCHYEFMACNVVAAFKFEAFLNHLGYRLMPDWKNFERKPYRAKLKDLLKHLKLLANFNKRPFMTLRDLFEARNQVAHGKPGLLEDEEVAAGTREELRRKKPLLDWEKLCNREFAKKAYDDTEEIAETLWLKANLDLGELRGRGHSYSIEESTDGIDHADIPNVQHKPDGQSSTTGRPTKSNSYES